MYRDVTRVQTMNMCYRMQYSRTDKMAGAYDHVFMRLKVMRH